MLQRDRQSSVCRQELGDRSERLLLAADHWMVPQVGLQVSSL